MATNYTIAFTGPHVIEIGIDSVIEAVVYSGASSVTPASGTVTVTTPDGTALVDAAGATSTYTVLAASSTGQDPSIECLAVWSLTLTGGTVLRATNRVILTKYVLRNPVSNATLLGRQPTWNVYQAGKTSHQEVLDAVWGDTLNRLLDDGRNPHRIRNSYGLAPYVTFEALARVADQRASYVPDQEAMRQWAAYYRQAAAEAWGSLKLDTDIDDDGDADAFTEQAEGVIFTSETPDWPWGGASPRSGR